MYRSIGSPNCLACNCDHSLWVKLGDDYPSRSYAFECEKTNQTVRIDGFPHKPGNVSRSVPEGGILARLIED